MRRLDLLNRWSSYRKAGAVRREKEAALVEALEHMVKEGAPAVRAVAGYRKQLLPPMESALSYMEGLIRTIPGPFTLSTMGWDKDPFTHSLFFSPDEIRSLFDNSPELKSFFLESGKPSATILLTATKKERTIFGTKTEGEITRRDVPQLSVEFYDHRIMAPTETIQKIHRELVRRGLVLLAAHALEKVMEVDSNREELLSQRRILEIKLKILATREKGRECLLAGRREKAVNGEAERLLSEIDRQIMELGPDSGTPRAILGELKAALGSAGEVLAGKSLRMRIDRMGVRLNDGSAEKGAEIELAELEMPGTLKRVAVLAIVHAAECPDSWQRV